MADPCSFDGIDREIAEGLPSLLAARGITAIGGGGRPVAENQAVATNPFRPTAPEKHLLSQFLRCSAEAISYKLFCASAEPERARLLSASGPTAGTSLVAPLNTPAIHYTDKQWSEALRWRIGIATPGPSTTCMNQKLNEELCNEPLDAQGDRAASCGVGPLRTLRHDTLADIYADILDEVGAVVRREVFVPEFSLTEEAWLDVWSYGIPELPDLLLDITVRHPRASRYLPGAAQEHGSAARHAEIEKLRKYPAAHGRAVWPIAHETWGRLGDRAEQLLSICAAIAARKAHRRGRAPGNSLRRWRAQLDAALHRGIAAQLVAAREGLPGKKRRRTAPADRALLEGRCPL